jgi:chromosome partitioning protein
LYDKKIAAQQPTTMVTTNVKQLKVSALLPSAEISLDRIGQLGADLEAFQDDMRDVIFKPNRVKNTPTFTLPQLATLCRLTDDSMQRRLDKAVERGLPAGTLPPTEPGKTRPRKVFTVADAQAWVAAEGIPFVRPGGVKGCTIAVGNFKGGVGKTTLSMSIAQGLSLRGYKVLMIDLDPQGSLTSLTGLPTNQVDPNHTFLPLTIPPQEPTSSSEPAHEEDPDAVIHSEYLSPQPTYWPNIDLIAGSPALFQGEFYLPIRQMNRKAGSDFMFMKVLTKALDHGLRDEYDYIVIDTPPALSYVTMNAYWAADGIVMPVPPDGLDFSSSIQFWQMFKDLAETAAGGDDKERKAFSWINVVPSLVDHTKPHTKVVLKWLQSCYADFLSKGEIPDTGVANVGGLKMQTVYDISKYTGGHRTYARAREAYDRVVDEIDHLTRTKVWGEALPVED